MFLVDQKVKVIRNCEVTGLRLKRGMLGIVRTLTIHQDPPLYWVKFPEYGEVAMKADEIEVVSEKRN